MRFLILASLNNDQTEPAPPIAPSDEVATLMRANVKLEPREERTLAAARRALGRLDAAGRANVIGCMNGADRHRMHEATAAAREAERALLAQTKPIEDAVAHDKVAAEVHAQLVRLLLWSNVN